MSTKSAPLPSLWHNRDYMLLWSGQMISMMGNGMSGVALPLLVLSLTHSPTQVGIVDALMALPYVVFSLPAGALIDRWDRKRVMIICDVGRGVAMASIPLAAIFGHITLPHIYAVALVAGSLFVFFNIAEAACLPRVVPPAQLPTASAQNEGGGVATGLLAPPLGGILFQAVAQTAPFVVDAVSYLGSVVSLFWIKTSFQGERPASRGNLSTEIAEGMRWLWHQSLIRYMAFLTGGLNFTGAAVGLLVIVRATQQHAPASLIGTIFAVGSVGGILGALAAPRIQRRFGFGQVIIGTTWLSALLWPLFAIASSPLTLGLVFAGMLWINPIYNAVQYGYRLSIIPDVLQGRVNSSFRLIAFGFQPLGAAVAGVLIGSVGVPRAALFYSVCTLVLAVMTTLQAHVRRAGIAIS